MRLPELPEIRLGGLSAPDAGELLASRTGRPVDGGVTERLVTETGGNPLALLDAAGDLSPDQLAGRTPLPEPLPIGHRLEASFARRIRELSPATRTLLLLAAADHPGRSGRLWRAAAALGIPESAAVAAEVAGVAVFWPEVRFSHPLVRSAVYATATTLQRRQAHQTLAAASDEDGDVDIRAWHLAAAAAGPDEEAAAEQEAAAERARSRGGYAAAAALLERAALLTGEPGRRAERRLSAAQAQFLAGVVGRADELLAQAIPALSDPLAQAQATRLRGRIQYARGEVAEATDDLAHRSATAADARSPRGEGRAALGARGLRVRRLGRHGSRPGGHRTRGARPAADRRATGLTREPAAPGMHRPGGRRIRRRRAGAAPRRPGVPQRRGGSGAGPAAGRAGRHRGGRSPGRRRPGRADRPLDPARPRDRRAGPPGRRARLPQLLRRRTPRPVGGRARRRVAKRRSSAR